MTTIQEKESVAGGFASNPLGVPAAAVREFYTADDWHTVERYWQSHPSSVQELAAAMPAIEENFATSAVHLQVQSSPDGDGPPILFVNIAVEGDDARVFGRMRQFDKWCAEHLPADFSVAFDVEFA